MSLKPKECAAIKFVIHLLQESPTNLHTLTLDGCPEKVRDCHFGQDWTPRLPQLKVLEVQGILSWKDMFLKVINAAPILQNLVVQDDVSVLDIVQQLHLLDLALSFPSLSKLFLDDPLEAEHEDRPRYFRVLQILLHSSCKTLKALRIQDVIFPFHHIKFPALVNMKKLTIYTGAATEELIHVLQSIDYTTLLPALETVEETAHEEDELLYVSPWGNNAITPIQPHNARHSATVKNLTLEFDINPEALEARGRLFTNVSPLILIQTVVELDEIPYKDICTHWSQVEFMEMLEADIELGENLMRSLGHKSGRSESLETVG